MISFDKVNWKNKDEVLEAVSQNGRALKFAPDFQDDPDIVIAAVKSAGDEVI